MAFSWWCHFWMSPYMKFYFYYIFHICVLCFNIYLLLCFSFLLHISIFILFDSKFVWQRFYFHYLCVLWCSGLWCRGVVIITTAQLHSKKPELRFCPDSNLARGMSDIHDGEDFWQWSRLKIRLNTFRRSIIPQKLCLNYV